MTDHPITTEAVAAPNQSPNRELSGRWVVAGMFAFALSLIACMYGYWHYHRAAFLDLQTKLAEEFPKSRPLVEGGQRKMHRNTPRILRITMEVPFDPQADATATDNRVRKVVEVLKTDPTLETYETIEVVLFQQRKEEKTITESREVRVDSL